MERLLNSPVRGSPKISILVCRKKLHLNEHVLISASVNGKLERLLVNASNGSAEERGSRYQTKLLTVLTQHHLSLLHQFIRLLFQPLIKYETSS